MKIKNYVIGVFLAVFFNSIMLMGISSPVEGLHERNWVWVASCIVAILGTIMAAKWLPGCGRGLLAFVCGLTGGAILASMIDALSNSMVVHNQFLFRLGENGAYFNLPDILMVSGVAFVSFVAIKAYFQDKKTEKSQKSAQKDKTR